MAEENTSSFTSFWQRSMDAVSTTKLKFMPDKAKLRSGENDDENILASTAKKLHRRAQVRKAQSEHRQRKENYVKHLEQDVLRLRDLVSVAEKENSFLKEENAGIKDTLSRANRTISFDMTNDQVPQQYSYWHSSTPLSSLVNIGYDEPVGANCLHIHSATHSNNFADIAQPPNENHQNVSLAQSDIAVNFVLALEHPCRTHFPTPSSADPDPNCPESGHTLMASTHLFSYAPPTVFSNIDNAEWEAPSLGLEQLLALSQSLELDVNEITPVQAWFLLEEEYGITSRLVGQVSILEKLKRGLGCISKCFAFGAVMDQEAFREVVRKVLGNEAGLSGTGNLA